MLPDPHKPRDQTKGRSDQQPPAAAPEGDTQIDRKPETRLPNKYLLLGSAALASSVGAFFLCWQMLNSHDIDRSSVVPAPVPERKTMPPPAAPAPKHEEVQKLIEPVDTNKVQTVATRELVETADDLLRKNQSNRALSLYEEALSRPDIGKVDSIMSRALGGKTSALLNLHLHANARVAGQKWLDFQSTKNDKRTLAYCYAQLGNAYQCDLHSPAEASFTISCFQKAIDLDKEINFRGTEVSSFYQGIGLTLAHEKQLDKALAAYKQQLSFCSRQKGSDWDLQCGLAHYYCGHTYAEMQDFAKASKQFELAITPIRKHLGKDTTASIYKEMADTYEKQGEKRKAEVCLAECQKLK